MNPGMGGMNLGMNPGMGGMNPGMNNPGINSQKKFNYVKFNYIDEARGRNIPILVQVNNNMTVQQLISNFKIKLGEETVKKFLLNGNALDPSSTANITSIGIDDKSEINAIA